MADQPRPQEIQKLLDNPAVSEAVKMAILAAYPSDATHGGVAPFGQPEALAAAMTRARRQVDSHDAESGRQALADSRTGATDSNLILDQGAPGLHYFQYFAPLYRQCVSGSVISRDKAVELYDAQRDVNFAALRIDGVAVTKGASTLATEMLTQRNSWHTIAQVWSGGGAEAANAYVDGYLGQAGVAQSQVENFGALLAPAADALEQAVRDKAQFVAGLYTDTIGGKTPEQIGEIIYYSQHGHDIFTSLPAAKRILAMFGASTGPDVVDGILAMLPAIGGRLLGVGNYARELLDNARKFACNFVDHVFKPDVEARWHGLVQSCSATDTSVREIYRRLVTEANAINDHPFPDVIGDLPVPSGDARRSATRPQSDRSPVQTQPLPAETPSAAVPPPQPSLAGSATPSPRPPLLSPAAVPGGQPKGLAPRDGLPVGAGAAPSAEVGWVREPTQLPQDWTIDSKTGELSAPGVSAADGVPDADGGTAAGAQVEVHSVTAGELLDHNRVENVENAAPLAPGGSPAPGAQSSADAELVGDVVRGDHVGISSPLGVSAGAEGPAITFSDHGSTLTLSAEEGGKGVDIVVSDPAGHQAHWKVEMGADGLPQLMAVPVDAVGVAAGSADAAAAVGAPPSAGSGVEPAGVGFDSASGAAAGPNGPADVPDSDAGTSEAGDAGAGVVEAGDAGARVADAAGADGPAQVRAASAIGWSDTPDGPQAGAPQQGGTPALAHADPVPGGDTGSGSRAAAVTGGLLDNLIGASSSIRPADQWLLGGATEADESWDSLASVLGSGGAPPDRRAAALVGPAEGHR